MLAPQDKLEQLCISNITHIEEVFSNYICRQSLFILILFIVIITQVVCNCVSKFYVAYPVFVSSY